MVAELERIQVKRLQCLIKETRFIQEVQQGIAVAYHLSCPYGMQEVFFGGVDSSIAKGTAYFSHGVAQLPKGRKLD